MAPAGLTAATMVYIPPLTRRRLTKLPTGILLVGFCLHTVTVAAQSNALSAKQHLERARSYSAAKDPRAKEEFKQAIAVRGGKYPEAWEAFSTHLAYALKFKEAAAAFRKYVKQTKTKVSSTEQEHLKRLDRAALLRSRHDDGQSMSLEEMLELTKLVDGFGSPQDAVPYAEKMVEMYPQSGEALVAVAEQRTKRTGSRPPQPGDFIRAEQFIVLRSQRTLSLLGSGKPANG